MTQVEFMEKTKWLCNLYNKSFNEDQLRFWYSSLQGYDANKYSRAITFYGQNSKYMPTISEMLTTLREMKNTPEEEQPKEKVPCKACNSTGYVLYKKVVNGIEYEYASQCNCPNARGLDYDGSKIADKEHRSDYYLAKAVDVFKISEKAALPTS